VYLAQFDQHEPERFDLSKDAEHGGLICKPTAEDGLAPLQLGERTFAIAPSQSGEMKPTPTDCR